MKVIKDFLFYNIGENMKWTIDKQFSFCYGHRVWSQQLEHEYCEKNDTNTKCRHLHGHEGLVHVYLESDTLERGMVTDFKHLGWLKNVLDDVIDHKFIIDLHDPHFEKIINGHISGQMRLGPTGHPIPDDFITIEHLTLERGNGQNRYLPLIPITVSGVDKVLGYRVDTNASYSLRPEVELFVEGPEKEFYDGFVIVDFVPTSENLCKWLFETVSQKMSNLGIKVSKLDWWETPKSRSSISAE